MSKFQELLDAKEEVREHLNRCSMREVAAIAAKK